MIQLLNGSGHILKSAFLYMPASDVNSQTVSFVLDILCLLFAVCTLRLSSP